MYAEQYENMTTEVRVRHFWEFAHIVGNRENFHGENRETDHTILKLFSSSL